MDKRIEQLIEAVKEIPNVISADLETGSHHMNNAAHRLFAKEHHMLLKHLDRMTELAYEIAPTE